jgi:hypothetical protein
MKRILLLLFFAAPLFAQQQVPIVSGVVTINASQGTNFFKVTLNANVTSVVINQLTPVQQVTLQFTENSTGGYTVAFGGNISGAGTVTTTANATTVLQFTYDQNSATWFGVNGGGGGLPSGTQAQPLINTTGSTTYATSPVFYDAYQFSSTAPDTAINDCPKYAVCDAEGFTNGSYTTTAQINLGDSSGHPMVLKPPVGGLYPNTQGWFAGSMTDGTSCTMKQYGGTAFVSASPGNANQFRLGATFTSDLGYVYCTAAAANGEDYFRADGLNVFNHTVGTTYGHATANGVGAFISGSADASTFEHGGFFDDLDAKDLELQSNCCGVNVLTSIINGNYGSTTSPLWIQTSTSQSGGPYNFDNDSVVHEGNGQSLIVCNDSWVYQTMVHFHNIYSETNTSDANPTAFLNSGCRIDMENWNVVANHSGVSGTTFSNANFSGAYMRLQNINLTNGTGDWFSAQANGVVDLWRNVTIPMDSNNHLGSYDNGENYEWGDWAMGHRGDVQGTIASASTIAPVNPTVFVTGTAAISTITPPTGCTLTGLDCTIKLFADPSTGPFTLTTGGNIYAAAAPAIGTAYSLTYIPANSTWYGGSSSTGVSSVSGTTNEITVTGSTTPVLSIPSTFVAPGSIEATTALTVGASAPSACGSATGCIALSEAGTAGTPTAGVDYQRADSGTHKFLCSFNGGAEASCGNSVTAVAPLVITGSAVSLQNSASVNITAAYGTDTNYPTASGGAFTSGDVIEGDAQGGEKDSGTLLSSLVGAPNVNLQAPVGGASAGSVFAGTTGSTFGYLFMMPASGSFGHFIMGIGTADSTGTDAYEIGIYNAAGTSLLCTTGSQTSTTLGFTTTGYKNAVAVTSNCVLTAGNFYIFAIASITTNTAKFYTQAGGNPIASAYSSLAGSVFPGSVTPPTTAYQTAAATTYPWFDLTP